MILLKKESSSAHRAVKTLCLAQADPRSFRSSTRRLRQHNTTAIGHYQMARDPFVLQ